MLEKLFPGFRVIFGLGFTNVRFAPGDAQHLQLSNRSTFRVTDDPNVVEIPDGKSLGVRREYGDGTFGPWVNVMDQSPHAGKSGQVRVDVQSPDGHQTVATAPQGQMIRQTIGDIPMAVEYQGREKNK